MLPQPSPPSKGNQQRKIPIFTNVPAWAPKKGKYQELGKPIIRWLHQLVNGSKDLKDSSGSNATVITALKEDEDFLRLCAMVHSLMKVNWELNKSTILLPTEEPFVDETMEKLLPRIYQLRDHIAAADAGCPKLMCQFFPTSGDAIITRNIKNFKELNLFHQSMPIFITLTERLQKFVNKSAKINFASVPMKNYNMSLTPIRIDIHEACCAFLDTFLPPKVELIDVDGNYYDEANV